MNFWECYCKAKWKLTTKMSRRCVEAQCNKWHLMVLSLADTIELCTCVIFEALTYYVTIAIYTKWAEMRLSHKNSSY